MVFSVRTCGLCTSAFLGAARPRLDGVKPSLRVHFRLWFFVSNVLVFTAYLSLGLSGTVRFRKVSGSVNFHFFLIVSLVPEPHP